MRALSIFVLFSLFAIACTPRIQLDTPPEGITINMNVIVDHKIDVQFDEKAKAVLEVEHNKQ